MTRRGGSYGRFAAYYDFIYHDIVNYEGDVDFLDAVFRRLVASKPQTVLDLGCGTGNHDFPLAERGYRVTGLDRSEDQLAVARRKARQGSASVRFVRGDMRSFRLAQMFDCAVCMFGAFGYLTKNADAVACLRSVRRHLRPGGLFVFEFWQTPAVRPRDDWFHKVGRDFQLIRLGAGRFDRRRSLLSVEYRFFVLRARRLIDRFDETHVLRTHTVPEMRALLAHGGFDLLATYGATPQEKGFRPVTRRTFRILAVARPRAPKQS